MSNEQRNPDLTGREAIEYAEASGIDTVWTYDAPADVSAGYVSLDEAREIAAEDPSLIRFDAPLVIHDDDYAWTVCHDTNCRNTVKFGAGTMPLSICPACGTRYQGDRSTRRVRVYRARR